MKMENVDLKVSVNSDNAVKRIDKATFAVNQLKKALDDLKDLEIVINIVPVKKHWYQFWK